MRSRVFKILPVTFALLLCLSVSLTVCTAQVQAPSAPVLQIPKAFKIGMFKQDYAKSFFDVEDVSALDDKVSNQRNIREEKPKDSKEETKTENPSPAPSRGPVFVGDFKPGDILPPDETPRVRINPDAPSPFIAMATANQEGDKETAAKYAEQWVRYQQNYFFEVRQITDLIGKALVKQKVIDDDDWQGVPQYIDYELAKSRAANGAIFKPTHEQAMARIRPDSKGEAGVYYFFTMNCVYCRAMASDVERLYQAVQSDPKVKMVGLTMGPTPRLFIDEYRKYSGATFPIFEGPLVAKEFNLQYVPAVVVVAPNGRRAYVKSGQQSFERMLEFVRRVQGKPLESKERIQQFASLKVGAVERAKLDFGVDRLGEFLRPEDKALIKNAEQTQNTLVQSRNVPMKKHGSDVKF